MWFEDFIERIWEHVRSKESTMTLKTAFRYWILDCKAPW